MMVKANRNVPSDRMVAAVLDWCGASVYRRTGWAGWRMSWEPCPVVLRLPFGERAGLLGDSVFSTSSWFLSLPILFRYRWFPILPLDVAINDQTDRARLCFLDVCFISTFSQQGVLSTKPNRSLLRHTSALSPHGIGYPRTGKVDSLLAKTCWTTLDSHSIFIISFRNR
jgi:hypothetical protein